jgi:hypothetical protein
MTPSATAYAELRPPQLTSSKTSGTFSDHAKHDNETPAISQTWILLDSESTVSIFNNKKLLKNIRHCGNEQGLRVFSNGGHQDTHMVGDLPALVKYGTTYCR